MDLLSVEIVRLLLQTTINISGREFLSKREMAYGILKQTEIFRMIVLSQQNNRLDGKGLYS